MKLNDLVSFIRFALNGSPHIKTSEPTYRLFFSTNAQTCTFVTLNKLPIDQQKCHTTDIELRCLLKFKTTTVSECDLLRPASALTETVNLKKSKFKISPCKTSICDQGCASCFYTFEAKL